MRFRVLFKVFKNLRGRQPCLQLRSLYNLGVFSALAVVIIVYILLWDQEQIKQLRVLTASWNFTSSDVTLTYCQKRKQFSNQTFVGLGDVHESTKRRQGQQCIHPELNPCDPTIVQFDYALENISCSAAEENWVYVDNGTFRISKEAKKKYGLITCEYAPLIRAKGDFTVMLGEHIKPMLDGTPLVSDFFKVACISPSGKRYHSVHAGVAFNATLHSKYKHVVSKNRIMGYDVLMFGFDSTSRMSWLRNLPKTRDYFINTLGGLELEGYNIAGDGTVQALLPILAGNMEADLHQARRGFQGASEVDDFPWIWKQFHDSGYVTAWGEDMSHTGTFQLRLKGFKQQPTDHSMRTYFLSAEPMYSKFLPWCIGSERRQDRFFNWFRDVFHMYQMKPKFVFGFHSEYSHSDNNNLKQMDQTLLDFLTHLQSNFYLDNAILILMADHGARFSNIRTTPQGKIEERMPYFSFRFPPSFKQRFPQELEHFKTNLKRLTGPFDIHETFHHMLDLDSPPKDHTLKRGMSLFREVPKSRTCAEAGIETHWCACLNWQTVDQQETIQKLRNVVINAINDMLSKVKGQCALLEVKAVSQVLQIEVNKDMLKFRKSLDIHGDKPDLSDSMTSEFEYFQITLETTPGGGLFEATVEHSLLSLEMKVSEKQISRINKYGDAPKCIEKTFPHLRPYCVCLK